MGKWLGACLLIIVVLLFISICIVGVCLAIQEEDRPISEEEYKDFLEYLEQKNAKRKDDK